MSPRRRSPVDACPGRSRFAAAAVALLWVGAQTMAAGAATPPKVPLASLTDCQNLERQFDVAWTAHRDAPRAASARRSREQGEAECRAGHYAEGVVRLRRALHDIGLKPVKSVARAPQR